MKCNDIQVRLPELIDGTISADEKLALDDHLAHCPMCEGEFEELSALFAQMKSDVPWSPPQAYWNALTPRIHERINKGSTPVRFIPAWIQRVAVTAAAVAIIYAGFNIVPANIEEKSIDLRSLVAQGSPEEIQSFVERQQIEGLSMSSLASADNVLITADDKTDLREVIGEDFSSVDADLAVESLSNMDEQAVKDIVEKLDQQAILN
jgi:hypothetical protein